MTKSKKRVVFSFEWRKVPPDRPGLWLAYLPAESNRLRAVDTTRVVEVVKRGRGFAVQNDRLRGGGPVKTAYTDTWWAGPIQTPIVEET